MHRTSARSFAALLVAAGVTVGLVSCGGEDEQVTSSSTVPGETSTTTLPPPSTTTVAVSTTTTGAQPTTTVSRPQPVVAGQGERVFAVFMATGDDLADPVFGAAEARLAELGYDASSSGETGCSQGARERCRS